MAKAVRVGLLLGDPCGIGPELVARLVTGGELDPDTATIVRLARALGAWDGLASP